MKKITTLICVILIGTMTLQAQDAKPYKGDNGKYGVKSEKGKVIVQPKYDYVKWFSEGMAFVNKGGVEDTDNWLGGVKGGKWGVIDTTGKEIVSLKYHEVRDFKEGLAGVKLNGKWGFINKAGKEVISLKYDDAWGFFEGLSVVKLNKKFGFIDYTGKEAISLTYDGVYNYGFENGKAKVSLDYRDFYIDKEGKRVQ